MSYRDELDAAQARAEALEKELEAAKAEIAELKGETALVPAERNLPAAVEDAALERVGASSPAATRWLGAPTRLKLQRTLDGELPQNAYTEVVEAIRRILEDPGNTQLLPGSLTWSSTTMPNQIGSQVSVYLSVRDGRTEIRAEERLGPLAGGIFGGLGGGLGGGGIMLPLAPVFFAPALVAVTVPLWLAGVYVGCRKLYRGRARKRASRLEELMNEIVTIARDRIEREP